MLDFVIRVNKKYYPQTLLEECRYDIKKNKTENLINDNFHSSSSDESDNKSDSEPHTKPSDSELDSELDNESDNDESND